MSSRAAACFVPAAAVLLLLGLLAQRHFTKAFWYDEVWVLQYARQPSVFKCLSDAMERGSPVPAGYLAGLHAIAPLADERPWAWRLPSAIAAVALAAACGLVLWGATSSSAAGLLGALLLFAGPHTFQRYAFELKPYMAEAAMTMLFVGLVPALTRASERATKIWCLLALVSVTCLFSSQFAAAASWIVATAFLLHAGNRVAVGRLCGCAAIVAVAWIAMYVAYTGPVSRGTHLRDYWHQSYLTIDATLPQQVRMLASRWIDACWAAYPSVSRALIAFVMVAGLAAWVVTESRAGAAAALTIAITLMVSALGHWPLESRINLPALALLHVGPVVLGWRVSRMAAPLSSSFVPRRALTVALVLVSLAAPPLIAFEARNVPPDGQDVKAALTFTATHSRRDDTILLDSLSGTNVDAGVIRVEGLRVDGPRLWTSSDSIVLALSRTQPDGRAWIPVTHAVDHVAGLDGQVLPDGRVCRIAWSGRGTAVYVVSRRAAQ